MKIEVRGVIVPSMFDDDFLADYIEKGQLTPESKFRRELAAAPTDEPLTVYLNTPGGSVFAGNEMINAVKDWSRENDQPVEIVVGAMAASMGAAMVMTIPGTVKAHANAKIMFHSAISCMCGGAGAMVDEADLINQINADTKSALLSKTSLSPDLIEQWFSEGREGWISAPEALEAGIIDEIIGGDAEALTLDKAAAGALTDRGMKLAALKVDIVSEADPESEEEVNEDEDQDTPENEEEAPENDPDEDPDKDGEDDPETDPEKDEDEEKESDNPEEDETPKEDEEETGSEAPAASVKVEPSSEIVALSEKIEEATASARDWQAKHDRAIAQFEADAAVSAERIEGLEKSLEKAEKIKGELEARVSKLSLQAVKLPENDETVMTWVGALKLCGGDFAKAKRQFPQVHEQFYRDNQKGNPAA